MVSAFVGSDVKSPTSGATVTVVLLSEEGVIRGSTSELFMFSAGNVAG